MSKIDEKTKHIYDLDLLLEFEEKLKEILESVRRLIEEGKLIKIECHRT